MIETATDRFFMKSVTLPELEAELERNPEDWSIRLRLIEGHILEENKEAARRLVRESPDDTPLPSELQLRLHTVMTQGAPAVERYYAEQHDGASPFLREERTRILPLPPERKQEDIGDGVEDMTGVSDDASAGPEGGDLKKKISVP